MASTVVSSTGLTFEDLDQVQELPLPAVATDALPGSRKKVEVLAGRMQQGLALWSPADTREDDDRGLQTITTPNGTVLTGRPVRQRGAKARGTPRRVSNAEVALGAQHDGIGIPSRRVRTPGGVADFSGLEIAVAGTSFLAQVRTVTVPELQGVEVWLAGADVVFLVAGAKRPGRPLVVLPWESYALLLSLTVPERTG